ncbi:E3 ubiquitin-protein ligase TRAIP [Polypterus senegalus]|uniref:E3 ubiquitin-protein ligase TRAIP n=1 Tax=Polypterus senegalus TaxID=55291 RepID=UPI00196587B8|nr:E3 ubiquitin-protein ligase TRAIP [Polypterus senegalus]
MPIRAYCIICSDFFDHSKDVSAIHCGHTFHYECLLQWFQTAPSKTCPQCRKQVSTKHIINRLFFDVGTEEGTPLDAESLKNEVDNVKILLSSKEKEIKECQKIIESLRETVHLGNINLQSLKRELDEKDMLCSALRKQMQYLEKQQNDAKLAKEESQRLRSKLKTFESLDLLIQGQRKEVEAMVKDMGVGQSAVEQLSIYCISLKKEYENLKASHKTSNEMIEKMKKELFSVNNKLQKTVVELKEAKCNFEAAQDDLRNSDKQITSLKKKVEFLQKSLSTPSRTNEAISRLVFESPAPLELKQPFLHQPENDEDIDLNATYDLPTPTQSADKCITAPSKKIKLDTVQSNDTGQLKKSMEDNKSSRPREVEDTTIGPFLCNSLLFRKKTFRSMLNSQRNVSSMMRTGFDGLGGRTKFIQPSPLSEIRPLAIKAKRKKVTRPTKPSVNLPKLDSFLE